MSSLFILLRDKARRLGEAVRKGQPLFLVVLLGVSVLGFLPGEKLFIGKLYILQWFLSGMIVLFFLKNAWARAFLVWITIRTAMSYQSTNNLTLLTLYSIILVLLFHRAVYEKLKINVFLNSLCVIALIQIFWTYLQVFDFDPLFKDTPYYAAMDPIPGFMANTNLAGILLAMCIPAFFRKKWKYCLLLFIHPLMLMRCHAAYIALAVGLLFYIYKRLKLKWPIVIVVLPGMVFGWDRFISFIDGPRMLWWGRAVDLIKERPLTGYGLGQYRYLLRQFSNSANRFGDTQGMPGASGTCAHNDYIQMGTDIGLIGVAIIIGFLVWLFIKHRNNNIILTTIVLIGAISSLAFFTHYTTVGLITIGAAALMERGRGYEDLLHRT